MAETNAKVWFEQAKKLIEENEELAVAYSNAQKEIRVLKNKLANQE